MVSVCAYNAAKVARFVGEFSVTGAWSVAFKVLT
jgi:hypothetical protein